MKTKLLNLPLSCLQRGRYQPRRHFDEQSLKELAVSIKNQGLIEPLIVRETSVGCYEIIAGERRWRAAMMAGLQAVPCLSGEYTDVQTATLALVENIQRQDLNLIEEAQGYRRLHQEFNFQQDEIAALVSKSRSHVSNTLRLLTLCDDVQNKLITGSLSAGHARLLVGLSGPQQVSLARETVDKNWPVRKLEAVVKNLKNPAVTDPPPLNADIARLESRLAEQIGTAVEICRDNGKSGWLKVKFFDNETLEGLLDRMGLSYD